jgi:hypothetical protein
MRDFQNTPKTKRSKENFLALGERRGAQIRISGEPQEGPKFFRWLRGAMPHPRPSRWRGKKSACQSASKVDRVIGCADLPVIAQSGDHRQIGGSLEVGQVEVADGL